MRRFPAALAVLSLLLTNACSVSSKEARAPGMSGGAAPSPAYHADAPAPPPPPPQAAPPGGLAKRELGSLERDTGKANEARPLESRGPMLIYTATFHVAVFDTAAGLREIEDLAREVGGFLARRDDQSITIRVPVGKFQEVLARTSKVGDVLHRDVVAEDVTEEFADTEVRLKNARAVRERMEHLLAKATTVADSVIIEKELGRIAGEIERLEGRMKFLRDRAAYSTLTVRFEARKTEAVLPSGTSPSKPKLPFPWLNQLGLNRLMNL